MKAKLGELLNCSGTRRLEDGKVEMIGLSKILSQDLDIKIQYRFILLTEAVEQELKRFQTLQRKLFDKYGELETIPETNEDGTPKLGNDGEPKMKETGNLKLKPENIQKYNEEINQLLLEEIELWYEPVSINDLDGIKVSQIDLGLIKPFLIEFAGEKKLSVVK